EMIKFLARKPLVIGYPGGEQSDVEAEGPQQCSEGAVQFVAEATAAMCDDFLDESLRVEHNLAAQADVEVLEGDTHHVAPMQGAQGLGRWLKRSVIADAVTIGANIHCR